MNGENELYELHEGWVWTTLGEIAEYINGKAFKKSEWETRGRPIIRIQNLTNTKNVINRYSKPIEEKYIIKDGDFLISWSATLGTYIYKGEEAVLNQHIFKVKSFMNKMFLFYLFSAYIESLKQKIHGTGMQHITKTKFENTSIPLPPLQEQKRIVSKIEELFTNVDAGVSSLVQTKNQLKKYRQSLLKYAFKGKLTEEWRKIHKDELEPASTLLEKIKKEQNKEGKRKKRKYKDNFVDDSDLYELPEGWIWTRIEEIYQSMRNGIYKPKKYYSDNGIACLRMYNINNGRIIWENIKRMKISEKEIEEYKLEPGDILINRVNSRELVGKAAIIPKNMEICVFESKNIRLKLNPKIHNEYVAYWFQIHSQKYFNKNAQQTVGMASINQNQISLLPIPLPPLKEQQQIVEILDQQFSIIDELEKTTEINLKKAERLRQSILKKAFKGKLVPQDPSDEPAHLLLERIKAQKEREKNDKRKSKKNTFDSNQTRLIDYDK